MFGVALFGAALLSACENREERERQAAQAAVDSMAEARARGEVDLSNPEMGAKVLISLTADSIAQTHTSIPKGQVTFAVENLDTVPHVFQITGTAGNWKSMPISTGGTILMAMVLDPGEYEMFCPDSAGTARNQCGEVRKIEAQ